MDHHVLKDGKLARDQEFEKFKDCGQVDFAPQANDPGVKKPLALRGARKGVDWIVEEVFSSFSIKHAVLL